MKNTISNFIQNPFIKNVFILASGTAMAQGLNFLFTPLITRMYGPEAYGIMGTFQAIINMIAPIAALTYPISMVLPDKDKEAKGIAKLSLFITFLMAVIIFIIFIIFGETIVRTFNLESVSSYLYLLPIIIITAGLLQIIEQWLIRKNEFRISAKSNLVEVMLINSGKLSIGFVNPTASVLIFFTTFRQGIKAFLMFFFSEISLTSIITNNSERQKSLPELANKYSDFPLYRTPETFFNATAGSIPLLLLTSFFGPLAAGFYSLAQSVLGVPITLIGNAVGKVFFPKVSKTANDDKKITPLVSKATFYLAIVAIIPFGIIILFGPWLFNTIFGSNWTMAGEYARWLAIWSYSTFINRPCIQTLPVLSEQKFLLKFTISALVLKLIALFLGFYIFGDDIVAMALFGIVGALTNIYLILTTLNKCKKFDEYNIEFSK